MILKLRTHEQGWQYYDAITSFEAHGWIASEKVAGRPTRVFQSQDECYDWLRETYGALDTHDRTHFFIPAFKEQPVPSPNGERGEFASLACRLVTANRADGSTVVALIGQEAYLMSDSGDTVERL